jgi:putative tryptophan/tyrosine transport system substrate-binding protein
MGMKRRVFITLLGAATAWPLVARAQQSAQIRRVAVLLAEAVEDDPEYERRISTFAGALRDLGWIDGQNLKLSVHRVQPNAADIRKGIAELLAENPDIIVSGGGTTTPPVLQATSRIPVVFATAIDPVGSGFVESLAHPGGNATGFMQFEYSLSGKWLELLKQVSPATVRVGVVRDPTVPSGIGQFAVIQSVAGSVGADVVPIGTRDASEIESGMAKLARSPDGGLIATSGAAVNGHRDLILRLAARYRLPAVYASKTFVDHGGLVSYGYDVFTNYRRAAGYVDRILKGEKPADLPVQAPNKYDLVVNLKAAKALGLELPATLVARADEVIE